MYYYTYFKFENFTGLIQLQYATFYGNEITNLNVVMFMMMCRISDHSDQQAV